MPGRGSCPPGSTKVSFWPFFHPRKASERGWAASPLSRGREEIPLPAGLQTQCGPSITNPHGLIPHPSSQAQRAGACNGPWP